MLNANVCSQSQKEIQKCLTFISLKETQRTAILKIFTCSTSCFSRRLCGREVREGGCLEIYQVFSDSIIFKQ